MNWYAQEEGAGYFKREWLGELLNPNNRDDMSYMKDVVKRVRCWDLAGSVPSEAYSSPDWTVGVLMAKTKYGDFIIEDVARWRKRSGESMSAIMDLAKADRKRHGSVMYYLPQDPAQAGLVAKQYQAKLFASAGIPVKFRKVGTTKSKLTRFEPFTTGAENGIVKSVKGDWNEALFSELEAFDNVSRTKKDDQVDAISDSFSVLATTKEYKKLNPKMIG